MHKKIEQSVFPTLALLAVTMSMDQSAIASNANGSYTVLGPGNASCGGWIANRRYEPGSAPFVPSQHIIELVRLEAWVQGYVTSYNSTMWRGNNVASETDTDGMYAWIDTYCAAHPTDNIAVAAEALVNFLSKGPHPNSK